MASTRPIERRSPGPASTERRSLFERALEALPDGVLLTSADRKVLYANPAFARHWGISPELLQSNDEARMLQFVADQLVDPEQFRREVERLHPSSGSSQDELRFKDGRTFSRRSVPFEEDGAFQARIWVFTDITEARRATIDTLTGLPNRRAYSRDFPRFAEAADDGLLRAVALMDVDNFKTYNDHYGHAAGDAVLRALGNLLRSYLSNPEDLVFRIGGEEFLMAIHSRIESDAIGFFETLRQHIAALRITHVGNPPHDVVTASFGLQTFHGPREAGSVFRSVDAALYQSKGVGRNHISRATL